MDFKVGDVGVLVSPGQEYPGRVVATDVKGDHPLLILYQNASGVETTIILFANGGSKNDGGSLGSVYFSKRRSEWCNVYNTCFGGLYERRQACTDVGKESNPLPKGQLELVYEGDLLTNVKYYPNTEESE